MAEQAKVPAIRFAGFTDPWEQRKLGELGFAQSGIGFPDAEQGGAEGTPFFKVSDMNTPGNEYELAASKNYVTAEQIARMGWHPLNQVPAIFFAKVGAAVMLNRKRLVNEPFLLDNNTMAFSMDSSLLDTQFGQSLFERLDLTSLIQVGALPSFNSSDVESISVSLPSTMDEQRQIGQYLCNLNTLITLHQRKYDKLVVFKKSMLEKMFPKDGESVPEIRFAGFTDPWEQRKLGEVAHFINGRAYSQNELLFSGKYPVLRVGNFYTNDSWYYSNLELEDKNYAYEGDLLYTWSATFGPHIWHGNKVIYHYHIWKVQLEAALEKLFAFQLLERDKERILSDKNGSTMVHITKTGIENTSVLMSCSVEEQRRIGAFFDHLDSIITLHQRKLELLQNIKKSLLDKMFV